MSAVELEGLAYLSFFDDGSWFQVKFSFMPVIVSVGKEIAAYTRKGGKLVISIRFTCKKNGS